MSGASIEQTLDLWSAERRAVEAQLASRFGHASVAAFTAAFLDGLARAGAAQDRLEACRGGGRSRSPRHQSWGRPRSAGAGRRLPARPETVRLGARPPPERTGAHNASSSKASFPPKRTIRTLVHKKIACFRAHQPQEIAGLVFLAVQYSGASVGAGDQQASNSSFL